MTGFVIVAVLLTAAALLFVVPPLLRRPSAATVDRAGVNLQIHRECLGELDAAAAAGQIDADTARALREEVGRRLLEEQGAAAAPAARSRRGMGAALVVAALLPSLAAGLYVLRGHPAALREAATPLARADHPLDAQQLQALAQQLEQRLQSAPGDADGWRMLARSRLALNDPQRAATAYGRAAALSPGDASLLADYADVLAVVQGRRLAGAPEAIVAQALAVDPQHPKALALAGTAAFERGDFPRAIELWSQVAQAAVPDSPLARAMAASIFSARQRMAVGDGDSVHGRIRARVQVAPTLKGKLPPQATVFVFARADDGSRVPIAIARRRLDELPAEVILDDGVSMNPSRRLSDSKRVIVGARISASGQAQTRSGDLEAPATPVTVGGEVALTIDRVVP